MSSRPPNAPSSLDRRVPPLVAGGTGPSLASESERDAPTPSRVRFRRQTVSHSDTDDRLTSDGAQVPMTPTSVSVVSWPAGGASAIGAGARLLPHEVLEALRIATFDEIVGLSLTERDRLLQPLMLDVVSRRDFDQAVATRTQTPHWLEHETRVIRMEGLVALAIILAYAAGSFGFSVLLAAAIAIWVALVWRHEAQDFVQEALRRSRTQAQKQSANQQGETAQWLNGLLASSWAIFHPGLGTELQELINWVLEECPLPGMSSLELAQVHLGRRAPEVTAVQYFDAPSDDQIVIGVTVSYSAPKAKLRFKARVGLASALRGFTLLFDINKLVIDARGRVTITFDDKLPFPHVSVVSVTLLDPPNISFGISPLGTFDVLKIFPQLSSWLLGLCKEVVTDYCVNPEHYDWSTDPNFVVEGADGLMSGVLLVTVQQGYDFTTKGKRLGSNVVRVSNLLAPHLHAETKVQSGTNPQWNEQLALPVYNSTSDKIFVEVLDTKLHMLRSGTLGKKRFRLGSDLFADGRDVAKACIDLDDTVGSVDLFFRLYKLPRLPARFVPPSAVSASAKAKEAARAERELRAAAHAAPSTPVQKPKFVRDMGTSVLTDTASIASASALPPQHCNASDDGAEAKVAPEDDDELLHDLRRPTHPSSVALLFVRVHKGVGVSGSYPYCVVNFNGAPLVTTHWATNHQGTGVTWDVSRKKMGNKQCWTEQLVTVEAGGWLEFRLFTRETVSSDDFIGSSRLRIMSAPELGMTPINPVMIDEWLYLDLNKHGKPPETEREPIADTNCGKIRVSIIVRQLPVDKQLFASSTLLGAIQQPKSNKFNPMKHFRRSKRHGARRDLQTGGALQDPNKYARGGSLSVTIHACRDLTKMDFFGKSDPYVKVKLVDPFGSHEVHRTKVIRRSLNPSYTGESFTVTVQNVSLERLEFVCMDSDLLNEDDMIGSLVLNLSKELKCDQEWFDFTIGKGSIQISAAMTQASKCFPHERSQLSLAPGVLDDDISSLSLGAAEALTEVGESPLATINDAIGDGGDFDLTMFLRDDVSGGLEELSAAELDSLPAHSLTPRGSRGLAHSMRLKKVKRHGSPTYSFVSVDPDKPCFDFTTQVLSASRLQPGANAVVRVHTLDENRIVSIFKSHEVKVAEDGTAQWDSEVQIERTHLDTVFQIEIRERRHLRNARTASFRFSLHSYFNLNVGVLEARDDEKQRTLTLVPVSRRAPGEPAPLVDVIVRMRGHPTRQRCSSSIN
eukprot:m.463934 g.463934  ORF g.463934 m.463934 type:complete len:1245 (-) comp20355_c0_seq22:2837-6571(-)